MVYGMKMQIRDMKKRTLNELRQSKDFGYRPPSPSKDNPKFELSPTQIQNLQNQGVVKQDGTPLFPKLKKDINKKID